MAPIFLWKNLAVDDTNYVITAMAALRAINTMGCGAGDHQPSTKAGLRAVKRNVVQIKIQRGQDYLASQNVYFQKIVMQYDSAWTPAEDLLDGEDIHPALSQG